MKASPAWKLARRGKSAKDVLAARIRISVVATWRARNSPVPSGPPPNTARPICAMTVRVSDGTTRRRYARNERPRNITASRLPIHMSVVRALRHSGGRNAGIPLEMASTPVTAAPPEAKAWSTRNGLIAPTTPDRVGRGGEGAEPAGEQPHDPQAEQQEHHEHEEVGRGREQATGLADAAQVPPRDQPDEQDGEDDPVREQARRGGGDGGDARGHRHGDGEHVVGEEGDPRHLGREQAEVVPGDDVGPAGGGVRLDRLPVGEQQDREHRQDPERDGHEEGERGHPDRGDGDLEDLLGRVGHRGEVVRGEDGEGGRLAEALVDELGRRQRRSEEEALQTEADAARPDRGPLVGADVRLHRPEHRRPCVRGA
ncbi:MAG: hypothetical protein KatS3mg014_0587 [Actinomycetota bacterium]|nr:MAG: hypothetical protein KatS3mg014_0587 [Actinomycetota bacterium]